MLDIVIIMNYCIIPKTGFTAMETGAVVAYFAIYQKDKFNVILREIFQYIYIYIYIYITFRISCFLVVKLKYFNVKFSSSYQLIFILGVILTILLSSLS